MTAFSYVLAFVGFALLIILHEAGHFAAAKAVGMRVERFSLFFGRTPLRFRRGETEYGIGWIPLGGFVKISGMNPMEELPEEVRDRAYHAQPVWKRIVVIAAGPAVNLVLAIVLLVFFFAAIGSPGPPTNQIRNVEPGFPAAGEIRPGDRLVSVDGRRGDPATLSQAIASHRCAGPQRDGCRAERPATLVVERDGKPREITLRPVFDDSVPDQAPRPRLGFGYVPGANRTLPLGEAIVLSLDRFWFVTQRTLELPVRLFNAETRKEISGPVGGYKVTQEVIALDIGRVVGVLAVISLSLAVVNLFPFLPLDGGHIFWAVVEKVRGRPVPLAVMERSGVIGFVLVMIVFFIGLSNDLPRLISGEGFGVR